MATANQPDNPSYVCAAASRQLPALTICRDLSGGTPKMRAARTTYLPMEEGESIHAYEVRLDRSLLFNTFVKSREGLIGMALKKNPELQPDVPNLLRDHIEDIDLAGSHLDVFAKELFRDVINDGHAFILVDMQKAPDRSLLTLSPTPTALDDQLGGRRPYWAKYRKDDAINWKSDRINGATVLTQITFKQCATESDGQYSEKEVTRHLVFRLKVVTPKTADRPAVYGPMEWELYEEKVKNEPVPVDSAETKLTRIPVVPIYARRKDFLESDPPLLDLAYLNIGHWQQWSDLNCQIRMLVPILEIRGDLASPPIPTGEGAGAATQKLKIGPGAAVQFKDDKGGIEYKAADSGATQGMREALTDLEQRMSAVGLSVISPKPNQVGQASTATEKVMDQDERTSELSSWLRNLKDGIEAAMEIHAVDYLGLKTGGSIILGFDEANANPEDVTAISAPKSGMPGQG